MTSVCRLCLNSSADHYETITSIDQEYFHLILPEIDIRLVSSPVFCQSCVKLLQTAYLFKTTCIETERKLKLYASSYGETRLLLNTVIENPFWEKIHKKFDNNDSHASLNTHIKVETDHDSLTCELDLADDNLECPKTEIKHDETEISHSELNDTTNCDNKNNKKPFLCQNCNKPHSKIKLLLDHVKSHFRQAYCITCQKGFTAGYGLKRHLNTVHKIEMRQQCEENLYTMFPDQEKLDESLQKHLELYKDLLDVKERQNLDLERIKSQHRPFKPNVPEEKQEDIEYVCNTCEKKIRNKRAYRNHQLVHGNESCVCEYCQRKFLSKTGLKGHIATCHLGIRRKRTRTRKHICDICGFTTAYLYSLRQHKNRHTGERPFKCDKCPLAFTHENSLYIHKQTKHTTERTLTCEYCSKSFAVKQNLTKHILYVHMAHTIDKKFVCNYCGKKYRLQCQLNNHLKWHIGDRQFGCDICGKKFVSKDSVKKHRVIHFPEKPHKCEICGKGFHQKSNIKIHMKVHGTAP